MKKIEPKLYLDDQRVCDIRNAVEQRAAWLYLLTEEAEKRGLDFDFAGSAIYNCGLIYKDRRTDVDQNDMVAYAKEFFAEWGQKVFEQDCKFDEDEIEVVFHYCPLMASWQKLTDDDERIGKLCDVAMEGDRGGWSNPIYDFNIEKTLAHGDDCCVIRIRKKK